VTAGAVETQLAAVYVLVALAALRSGFGEVGGQLTREALDLSVRALEGKTVGAPEVGVIEVGAGLQRHPAGLPVAQAAISAVLAVRVVVLLIPHLPLIPSESQGEHRGDHTDGTHNAGKPEVVPE